MNTAHVHMNGRVYDPSIGKFLSADPFIQFPESTQGFNRYAYVGNNPLSANDPSGHFLNALQVVMLAYSTAQGMKAGGIKGALTGFVLGAASAGIANGIGGHFQTLGVAQGAAGLGGAVCTPFYLSGSQYLAKAALHGLTQGALSVAGGGRFGDGFLGGASGSLAEGLTLPEGPGGLIVTATIGGTVSKIGGGNFGNGALTAAMVHIFNCMEHNCSAAKDSELLTEAWGNDTPEGAADNLAAGATMGAAILSGEAAAAALPTIAARVGIRSWFAKFFGRASSTTDDAAMTVNIGAKVEGQLAGRGWTRGAIEETVANPSRTVGWRDSRYLPGGGRLNDPATAYYSRNGGYVVVNNRTGDVVQISNRLKTGWKAPWE